MERALALVVDDDPAVRAVIRDVFEEHDVTVLGAGSGAEAIEFLRSRPIGILILDPRVPGADRLELFTGERDARRAPILIGLVPADDGEEATRLIRSGDFDVLGKPVDEQALQQMAHRAMEQHKTLGMLRRLQEELQSREGYHGLVGRSDAMARLRDRLQQLGSSSAGAWFVGEPGTGKELAARTLHGLSGPGEAPFVVASCGECTEGDWNRRWDGPQGWLAQASDGTLYLEDLPELPMTSQERLLSVLSGGAGGHGGGSTIRFVASSKDDPSQAVKQGRLHVELQRLLASETLPLPALRDRVEDIPLLARNFITTICEINHLPSIRLAPDALAALERYHWPRNVQELRNTMEQAVMLSTDGTITGRELGDAVRESDSLQAAPVTVAAEGASLRPFREAKREVVELFERGYLRELMDRHGGNVTAASHQAGMLRSALQRLLRKYGLKSVEFRERRRAALAAKQAARPSVE